MPDLKISQLPAATTPLAGTELVPIVQSGTTDKVTVADLTAGRAVSASALTASSGNLTFSGTAQRITGDMSNATVANRLAFQTSTANGNTVVHALPNGTSVISSYSSWNAADPTNAAYMRILCSSTDGRLDTGISGTGTYLPMTFFTGNSEKLRIAADATGTYTFGGTAPRITGDMSNATLSNRLSFQTSTTNGNTSVQVIPNGTAGQSNIRVFNNSDPTNASFTDIGADASIGSFLRAGISGTGTYLPMTFFTGNSERMRIDTSGNVGIGTASPSGRLDAEGSSGATYFNFSSTAAGAASVFSLLGGTTSEQAICYNSVALRFGTVTGKNGVGFTERLRIDSSGNVGIGTSSPKAKLDSTTSDNAKGLVVSGATNLLRVYPYYNFGGNNRGTLLESTNAVETAYGDISISGNTIQFLQGAAVERMRITATGNIVAGASAALATNATDGFLYVPTCAGTPTGTPTAITGMAPIVVNTTNNKLYFYSGGAWRDAGP